MATPSTHTTARTTARVTSHFPSRPRSALFAVTALVASLSFAAIAQAAAVADVQLVDRNSGQRLPVYQHQGEYWVAGRPGASYSVDITNRTSGRILAVVSVDGVNAITGKSAAPTADDGYVLNGWQNWAITGWRKSDNQVAAFYFSESDASYAARTGRPRDVGVIGVALFRERRPEPVRPAPPISRRGPVVEDYASDGKSAADSPMASQAPMAAPMPPPQASPAARADAAAPAAAAERSAEAEYANKARTQNNADYAAKRMPSQPSAPTSPSLGTGHGALESSHTQTTDFDSATRKPVQIVRIRYDSYANLVAKGVIAQPRPDRSPNPFPASGYVPDPPRW